MTAPLKRQIGLGLLILYGLGTVIGVGIYAVIGEIAAEAGPYTPLSFLVAAILATFTAFSLGELSARYPESAGEAAYVAHGFGHARLSMLTGMMVILSGVVSAATIARGAVPYVQHFINLPDTIVIIALVGILGIIASLGVKESARIAAIISVIEILGLLLVIIAGWSSLEPAESLLNVNSHDFSLTAVFSGALLAFYAFIGFEDMVNMAEEVKDPERTMPRAILAVLCISGVLYIALALVLVSAIDLETLQTSETPLATVFEQTSGISGLWISAIGILAIINGGLIQIIMVARVLYGLARRGHLPQRLAKVNSRTHTPVLATALASAAVLTLALIGSLGILATATSMLLLVVFALINWSLVRIKKQSPPPADALNVPIVIPIMGALVSACFVLWKASELITRTILQ